MQQGLLASLLLSLSLLSVPSLATDIAPSSVQRWISDEQMQSKTSELLQYVVKDEVDNLKFSLERLAFPQQEVVRFLLLQKLEQQNIILTPKMAIFVEKQRTLPTTYNVVEDGDGYEISSPAFNYPAIAHRLLKSWKKDQQTMAFVMAAERQELVLADWLSGPTHQVKAREQLLIRELDSLSPEAVLGLTQQFANRGITSWLPSSQVLVRLAQVSEQEEVYQILWRKKADKYSKAELTRLASLSSPFATHQLIQAASNPSLNQQALTLLTRMDPLPENVKGYLISQMAIPEEASRVAQQLAKQGHESWLEELVSDNNQVRSGSIQQVLSQY